MSTSAPAAAPVAQASYSGGQALPAVGSAAYTAAQGMAAAAAAPASPLITTSSASRTNTANNVSTLNTATSNLSSGQLTKNGVIATPSSTATAQNIADAKAAGWVPVTTTTPIAGGAASPAGGSSTSINGSGSGASPAGGSSTSIVDSNGNTIDTTGMDPGLVKSYTDTMTELDSQITSAKATLASASATLANDPAASAAVANIQDSYEQQIELQKKKNAQMLGRSSMAVAAFGGLGQMSSDFLTTEQQNASDNIATITTKETSAVLAAQQAYQKGDLAAFNTASDNLTKLTQDKLSAIDKLMTASAAAVKDLQAQQKIDAANTKAQQASDIKLSTSVANSIAQTIKEEGLKDPATIKAYIDGVAQAQGITDPTILESAVTTAQGTLAKTASSIANTNSEINARNNPKPKTPAKPTGTADYSKFTVKPSTAEITKVNAYLQSIGANQAGIDAANADETTFYKVLNAVPKTGTASSTASTYAA